MGVLGQVFIVPHSYKIYFGFLGSDLSLDYEMCNHFSLMLKYISLYISNHKYARKIKCLIVVKTIKKENIDAKLTIMNLFFF